MRVTPKYPQKYTINGLPIKVANKNFLCSMSDMPLQMFIRKAGVKGNAKSMTKVESFICENFETIFNNLFLSNLRVRYLNLPFIDFLAKKKAKLQPMTVSIKEMMNPMICPKLMKFKVIKTESGRTGKIDSTKISKQPKIGP